VSESTRTATYPDRDMTYECPESGCTFKLAVPKGMFFPGSELADKWVMQQNEHLRTEHPEQHQRVMDRLRVQAEAEQIVCLCGCGQWHKAQ